MIKRNYNPVSVGKYNLLEEKWESKNPIKLTYMDTIGALVDVEARLIRVFKEGGKEFAELETGEILLLDQIKGIDGVGFL